MDEDDISFVEMSLAFGFLNPLYNLFESNPIGVLKPFSYSGSRILLNGVREAPQSVLIWLLQLPSTDLYLEWKQMSSQSASLLSASHPERFPINSKFAGDISLTAENVVRL